MLPYDGLLSSCTLAPLDATPAGQLTDAPSHFVLSAVEGISSAANMRGMFITDGCYFPT